MRYSKAFLTTAALLPLTAFAADPKPATDPRYGDLPHTDTNFAPAEYRTLDTWQKRAGWLRKQVRVAAGLWPMPERTPLKANIFGKLERDGYTIEQVHFESYPGFYVTGNLYRPRPPRGAAATATNRSESGDTRYPAVACPHGHFKNGRLHHDEVGSIPARCITLARLGAVVFAYDMLGWNDAKRQIDHRIDSPQRDLWGITSLHLQTWNSIRVLDFLQSLPDVDPERIGVTGASGGGTQTFILCAVDDRVKVAAPVNMISHLMQGGCVCENAPCLRIDTNNMEIGALMAPKPLLMVSATGDWTKDTPKVEYPFIRSVYALHGAAGRVRNVHIDAGHNYNQASREAMYRFFGRHLLNLPDADALAEPEIRYEKDEDMLVWTDETYPNNALTLDTLTARLVAGARARIDALRPDSASRLEELRTVVLTGLRQILGARWDMPVELKPVGGDEQRMELVCERAGRQVKMVRRGMTADQSPALQVWFTPQGTRAEVVEQEGAIVLAEPFSVAAPKEPTDAKSPRGSTKFFTTFNRTDTAETIFDMMTVLAAAYHSSGVQWQLRADGSLGPAALVARAMMPERLVTSGRLRTVIDMNGFDIDRDAAYLENLNLPHVRRLGGLRAIAAIACNGPIWFHNVGETFDEAWVKAAAGVCGAEVRITREKANEAAISDWLSAR